MKSNNLTTQPKAQTYEQALQMTKPVSERLTQQEEQQNAALIAIELDKVWLQMKPFEWTNAADTLKRGVTNDWVKHLRKYPVEVVHAAIVVRMEKNTFRPPTYAEVSKQIDARRKDLLSKLPKAPKEQEAPRSAPDDDEISRSRRFAAERGYRIPKALTAQQIEDGKNNPTGAK